MDSSHHTCVNTLPVELRGNRKLFLWFKTESFSATPTIASATADAMRTLVFCITPIVVSKTSTRFAFWSLLL